MRAEPPGLEQTGGRGNTQAFADAALEPATGEVKVELFQGRAVAVSRTSARSLYRPQLASFDMTGYQPADAGGFIRLFGLPLAVAGAVEREIEPAPTAPGGAS